MLYSSPMEKKQLLENFKKDLDLFMETTQDEFEIRRFIIDFCADNDISNDEIEDYIRHAPVWNVVPGILTVIGGMHSGIIIR